MVIGETGGPPHSSDVTIQTVLILRFPLKGKLDFATNHMSVVGLTHFEETRTRFSEMSSTYSQISETFKHFNAKYINNSPLCRSSQATLFREGAHCFILPQEKHVPRSLTLSVFVF